MTENATLPTIVIIIIIIKSGKVYKRSRYG